MKVVLALTFCVAAATAAIAEVPMRVVGVYAHPTPMPQMRSHQPDFGHHLDRPMEHKPTVLGHHDTPAHSAHQHQHESHGEHHMGSDRESKILRYEMMSDPETGYRFGYEVSDGVEKIERNEEAKLERIDDKTANLMVHGNVDYTNREGKHVKWEYTADKNGYVPTHITIA